MRVYQIFFSQCKNFKTFYNKDTIIIELFDGYVLHKLIDSF